MGKLDGFNRFQKYQIKKGLRDKVDVSIYSKIDLTWDQMEQFRLALKEGIDISSWTSELTSYEMENIRLGREVDKPIIEEEKISETNSKYIDHDDVVEVTSTIEKNETEELDSQVIEHVEEVKINKFQPISEIEDTLFCQQSNIEPTELLQEVVNISDEYIPKESELSVQENTDFVEIEQVFEKQEESWKSDAPDIESIQVDQVEDNTDNSIEIVEGCEEVVESTVIAEPPIVPTKKKKNTKIVIILLVSSLLLVCGVISRVIYLPNIKGFMQNMQIELLVNSIDIEKDSQFIAGQYIKSYSQDEGVTLEVPSLETDQLGTYQLEYRMTNGYKEISKILIVNVVDSQAPVILLNEESISLNKTKDSFDCLLYIDSAYDEVDGDLTEQVKCSNSLELSKDQQTVEYSVYDRSGNKGLTSLIVNFKKEVEVTSTKPGNSNNANKPAATPWVDNSQPSYSSGGEYYYEESWSSSGSYEVDSDVSVKFE
ncbi:hypothetical protein [Anaerorhabdus sp.]|uniref:hypothetical protein n=1 Tax=Anaerorhabdus sp. TaxID=1872524 RepID=UPI002FC5F6A2